MRLETDMYIIDTYCDTPEIPDVLKNMPDDDVPDFFLEIEEQLVAEYLVYGEVSLNG